MTEYLAAHPAIITFIVIFVIMLILYFVFKQFIKLALVILVICIVVAGVFYFQNPDKTVERIKLTADTIKSGTTEIVEKSKSFFKDAKELFNKTKEVPGDLNKLLKNADDKQK
jgi:uncharacterized protein YoxC